MADDDGVVIADAGATIHSITVDKDGNIHIRHSLPVQFGGLGNRLLTGLRLKNAFKATKLRWNIAHRSPNLMAHLILDKAKQGGASDATHQNNCQILFYH